MKALRANDNAVSPVIAVILMVAITVVLAAVVYVWVSGFNTESGSQHSVSFSSGRIAANNDTLTVVSASPGLKWSDLSFNVEGQTLAYRNLTAGTPQAFGYCVWNPAGWCYDTLPEGLVQAGTKVYVQDSADLSGKELMAIDAGSNAVLNRLTLS